MASDLRLALDAWKEADANARAAESLLRQAWSQYEQNRANAVPGELVRQVRELRAKANERLKMAVKLLNPERPTAAANKKVSLLGWRDR